MKNIVCLRCNKSVYTYKTIKKDPKTKKNWLVTSCSKCDFHFDLEEQHDPPEPKNTDRGWFKPAR